MTIGEKIKEIRKTLGWNQTEFAKLADIDNTTLNCIEAGRNDPGYDTLEKIIKAFKVNPVVLHSQINPKKEKTKTE